MDSLTQIVLGAACGEVVLGKRIGNVAMLFGAIGGTIPDLDVFIGDWVYDSNIKAFLFHRGFMHSLLFGILASIPLGYLSHALFHRWSKNKSTNAKHWIILYLASILTHPVLDCFTSYGTQLFLPFSEYRVAFSNISVADPFYTTPFLIALIIVLFQHRTSPKRAYWLKMGLGISSLYMLFTICNKFYINSVFENAFKNKGIAYTRYTTQPTLLNNFLWFGMAETEDAYYSAYYSVFDQTPDIKTFSKYTKTEETKTLAADENIAQLAWFSNDYFQLLPSPNNANELLYQDLRYAMISEDNQDPKFIFAFDLIKKGNSWEMKGEGDERVKEERSDQAKMKKAFLYLFDRIKGR